MARLTVTARADGGVDGWGFSIPVSAIASGDNIPITADPDDGQVAQLMPAQFDRFQRLRWLVELDDVALQYAQGIEWTSSIDRPIQWARCAVAADPARRLGTILPTGAPVGGMADVDVGLVFRQDNGAEFTEPLITGGLIVESPHEYRPSGIAETLDIRDANGRVMNKLVSRSYAAGSNTPRETVVNELAGDMGIVGADRNVPNMAGVLRKAVDIDRGDGLDLAQAVAEVDGWRLLRDRQGDFTARRLAPEDEARTPAWVFTPADWILSAGGQELGYQLSAAPDAYTSVALRGSRQVIHGEDGIAPGSGPITIITEGPFDPNAMPFKQDSDTSPPITISYTATGHTVPAQTRVLARTEIRFHSGIVLGENEGSEFVRLTRDSKTEGYYNRQKARVRRGTDDVGTLTEALVAYVTAQSLDRPGFEQVADSWLKISAETEQRLFTSENTNPTDHRWLKERTVERFGWYNPRVRIKDRNAVTDGWETATANSAYYDLGNGVAVLNSVEQYLLIERETEEYRRWNGLEIERRLTREAYGRRPGSLYLYSDGEFGDAQETFRVVYEEREKWRRLGESRWVKIIERYGIDGQRDPSLPTVSEYSDNGPPNIETLPAGADRFEQQEIRAEADADALLAVRPEHEFGPAVFEYAETEDELQSLAERLLLLSNGALLTFWIPPNPRCEVGQWVRFIGPPGSGLYHSAKVIETGIQGGDNAPIIQQVMAEIYPEIG